MKVFWFLLLIMIPLINVSCTPEQKDHQLTISLALVEEDGGFSVADYRVLDKPYIQSQQQGLYQAHLLDTEAKVLERISFDKIALSADQVANSADFYVTLPWMPGAEKINIYQLDGSSGHYQLKTDNPLLGWQIPDELRQKVRDLSKRIN